MAKNDEYLCRDFFSSASIFGGGYHSRYQNCEFTAHKLCTSFLVVRGEGNLISNSFSKFSRTGTSGSLN